MSTPQTNALAVYPEIARRLDRAVPAVFLDYDGTLTPIVDRPELAALSEEMRGTLSTLAQHCPVAIVSGRDRTDVEALVQLPSLYYAGSHGFDISGPNGVHYVHEAGLRADPALDRAAEELHGALASVEGALVERKRFAVAIHYRLVAAEDRESVFGRFRDVARRHPELASTTGKMVLELRPNVTWNKGKAIAWLLEALGLGRSQTCAIFLGDDVTDEDAFRAVQDSGIGILVAEEPRPSHARYTLTMISEVGVFLEHLVSTLGPST